MASVGTYLFNQATNRTDGTDLGSVPNVEPRIAQTRQLRHLQV